MGFQKLRKIHLILRSFYIKNSESKRGLKLSDLSLEAE